MSAAYPWVGMCLLTMMAALGWGFTVGDFWAEGARLVQMPWGLISIIDIYTGAALFLGWIAYRERSIPRVLGWALLIVMFGNLATSVYALLALATSRGHEARFWMGRSGEPA